MAENDVAVHCQEPATIGRYETQFADQQLGLTAGSRRALAILAAMLTMLLGQASTSQAQPSPGVSQGPAGVTVSGDVRTVLAYTLEALRALPSRTEAVTFRTATGAQSHTYLGCPLDVLLTAAQPLPSQDPKHPDITLAIVASGADGYAVTLSGAETSPAQTPRPALVAWSEDGVALNTPRLVVPDDLTGARYVSALTDLKVVQLAPH
jgi:DMSO/TMAO reductase YedYZ molybdopterin-dependent catalytic subunit